MVALGVGGNGALRSLKGCLNDGHIVVIENLFVGKVAAKAHQTNIAGFVVFFDGLVCLLQKILCQIGIAVGIGGHQNIASVRGHVTILNTVNGPVLHGRGDILLPPVAIRRIGRDGKGQSHCRRQQQRRQTFAGVFHFHNLLSAHFVQFHYNAGRIFCTISLVITCYVFNVMKILCSIYVCRHTNGTFGAYVEIAISFPWG